MIKTLARIFIALIVLTGAQTLLAQSSASGDKSEFPQWDDRYRAAVRREAAADALEALTVIAQRWPGELSNYPDRQVAAVAGSVGNSPPQEAAKLRLLEALYAAKWKFEYGVEPSHLWGRLARLLVERGQIDKAREVVTRIHSPRFVLALRVDKRFDALWKGDPRSLDVQAAVRRELADWQQAARRFPRRLDATAEVIYVHVDHGRYEEALALADATLAKIAAAKSPLDLYDDPGDALNWVYDYRARALRALGEWQELEIDLRNAVAEREWGGQNISNTINLASFYAELNRPDEALTTVARLMDPGAPVSGYGRMQVMYVRHAAALLKKDSLAAKESLEYMRDHRFDAAETFLNALLLANRSDEAAAFLLERLSSTPYRSQALARVQIYIDPPAATAEARLLQKRWLDVVNRSDVQAAILQVGRIEKFAIPPP